ncbi:MAG: hypothetical protein L6Q98_06040 [Anaerolineae bacterium]|nr:hypothetical protein [Anaerolineae bacterium]NUQ02744.1 hypothetical protein [Anaerolineae bacterium]
MTSDLIRQLVDTSLILFGAFRTGSHGDASCPYALQLEMLASYPAVLRQAAQATALRVTGYPKVDRLLCRADSLALGTLVSQETGIPLTYFDDRGHDALLVGAYDIGHPTVGAFQVGAIKQRSRGHQNHRLTQLPE